MTIVFCAGFSPSTKYMYNAAATEQPNAPETQQSVRRVSLPIIFGWYSAMFL